MMAKLYFFYASMNAGKSTNLLQADFNYRERGMATMLFTAAIDDRYAAGTITSRIGLSAPATAFDAAGRALAEGCQTEIGGNDRYVALCRRHFVAALHD